MRLPAFAVVAVYLYVSDRRAEGDALSVSHGEHGDFVVEINRSFHDDLAGLSSARFHRVLPRVAQILRFFSHTLAMSGRGHRGLYEAGETNGLGTSFEFFERRCETIGRGGKFQFFGSKFSDALSIHGEMHGARGRNHAPTLFLKLHKFVCRDGLYFRHDVIRLLLLNDSAYDFRIAHIECVTPVRDLHSRRALVPVAGNSLDTEPHGLDGDFFA